MQNQREQHCIMHVLVVSQMCCQLAHLSSKTDIPSTLHHQQDLDLLLTFSVYGDSWGGKGRQVGGYLGPKSCKDLVEMHSNLLRTVEITDLQPFNVIKRH